MNGWNIVCALLSCINIGMCMHAYEQVHVSINIYIYIYTRNVHTCLGYSSISYHCYSMYVVLPNPIIIADWQSTSHVPWYSVMYTSMLFSFNVCLGLPGSITSVPCLDLASPPTPTKALIAPRRHRRAFTRALRRARAHSRVYARRCAEAHDVWHSQ